MTQKSRASTSRIRPPYAEEVADEFDVLPRPVPPVISRVVIAVSLITVAIGAFLFLRARTPKPLPPPPVITAAPATSADPQVPPAPPSATAPEPPATAAAASGAASSAPAEVAAGPGTGAGAASSVTGGVSSASVTRAGAAPEARSARALINQAQALLNRGSFGHAAEVARKATQADPTLADGWLTLGGAYVASGNNAQARSAYRKCVELGRGPSVAECRALLAQ